MEDEAYDPGFFGDRHQQSILTSAFLFVAERRPGTDVSLLNGFGGIDTAVDIVDAFQVLGITQQEFQPHHKKGIVIGAIIYGAATGADDPDTEGLLYFFDDVEGIARLAAESGQIGDYQVVDVPVVLLDEGIQLDEIRPVEIGGAKSLIDEAVDRLHLGVLHPGTGDHILSFDAEMALFFGAEPEVFYSFLGHMDGFDLLLSSFGVDWASTASTFARVVVTTSSAIRLSSKMVL
ncbi:hypothetical protein Q4E93_09720 [Flavitalea sp. BT771]|nr:hypothetical protein [Flavitalea sp. BT771]MDO6430868.1 hypothetical protein [Flavitalea sp. BT771]MDV6218992.1 hypothetical protein [Flavitalea sp. BT771]